MVIVRLVLQPPLCGIGCRQILEMRRLLEILNLFEKDNCSSFLSPINNYYLLNHYRVFTDIIRGIIILHIICTAPLNDSFNYFL